ncbi:MAG: hypothetical protein IJ489_11150 [Clostridia bacterium]|nr:hypothetical protein [Clostridia bacterium]
MRKEHQKEFEMLIREHIGEFYAKAYAVKRNRAEAEILTEDAIVWGASKFSGLANKARVIDLIAEHIGNGEYEGVEPTDMETILSRAMESVRKKGKKKVFITGICTGVLMLAVGIGWVVAALPKNEGPPSETQSDEEQSVEIVMDDTGVIKGDQKNMELANYHNISKALNENTKAFDNDDVHSKLERHIATVTAPDGTKYMAFTHITEEKKNENNIVTLYRMETDGWRAIGTCEAQMNFGTSIQSGDFFYPSRIDMIADEKSNIYLFALVNQSVVVYRYDCGTGVLAKQNASLFIRYKPMIGYTFSIDYDAEKGLVYVGYCDQYKISFAYYDIAKNEFVSLDFAKKLGQSQSHKMFCVSGGVIHLVESTGNGNLLYYRIEGDGTVQKKTLFEKGGLAHENALYSEDIVDRGRGRGGIAVDKNGAVHIIATHWENTSSVQLVHYRITEDMNAEKETLPKLYYAESDEYRAVCGGIFTNENGDIYYLEVYRTNALQNVFAFGKLGEVFGDAPECIDVFEISQNITIGFMRVNEKTVVFFSENDIYYFELKGVGG